MRESANPEAERIKKEIDTMREQRAGLVTKAKELRRRLAYKERESVTVARLVDAGKAAPKRDMSIGYLRKLKRGLEFRISTEAKSLEEERTLVRRIDELNKRLSEAIASARLGRKLELVKRDIEQYRSGIMGMDRQIADMDVKLDLMYMELRRALGISAHHERPQRKRGAQARQQALEINLEDIAVIRKKEAKRDGS